TATGTVIFDDGITSIGQGILNGSGVATFATSTLAVGPHTISAAYAGDTNFSGSTSNNLTQAVTQAAVTSNLAASAATTDFGASVTFTATLTSAGGTPTGIVIFEDGATSIGQATLNAGGVATFSVASLPAGTHTISALYGGDTSFSGNTSNSLTQTVSPAATTTGLATAAGTTSFGASVIFTATLTSAGGTATGTVVFDDGSTSIGQGILNSSGVAVFATSALAVGPHTISAVYAGDTNFSGSTSNSLTQAVTQAAVTTTLTASAATTGFGASVIFTATLTSAGGTPFGTVIFDDGATSIGQATLNAGGVATFSVASLSAGTHTISALYGGDTTFSGGTSNRLTQTVRAAATTDSLTTAAGTTSFGASVTFTATLTSAGGTPTGTVVFDNGGTSIGQGILNGSGVATFATSTLAVGPHTISAVYAGDTNFSGSTSNSLTQAVTQAAVTSSLAASAATTGFGASVIFTATLTSAGGTPTGTVTFEDGSSSIGTGALVA